MIGPDTHLWHLINDHPCSAVWLTLTVVVEVALFVKEIVTW